MAGGWYNGYSWQQRMAPGPTLQRAIANGYCQRQGPCDLCGEPDRPRELHSEDYSPPYSFEPPQTYLVCKACHSRLHKRFGEPKENWSLFLRHLRAGGYGAEFVKLHSLAQRKQWVATLAAGQDVRLPLIRDRALTGDEWWEKLTLDPESLVAAWARPNPLRPRPTVVDFRKALAEVDPTDKERALLRCHANSKNHSASMRDLAKCALDSDNPSTANLLYGLFARRLCEALPEWKPDKRADGSPIWMSLVAEGWQPENREFEWVLIPPLREIFGA